MGVHHYGGSPVVEPSLLSQPLLVGEALYGTGERKEAAYGRDAAGCRERTSNRSGSW